MSIGEAGKMKKKIAGVFLLAVLLVACSGEPIAEIPAEMSRTESASETPDNAPLTATDTVSLQPSATESPLSETTPAPTPGKLDELILSSADLGGQAQGANLTPSEGCQGNPCAIRLWLTPNPIEGGEPNLLTVAVIEHPDAAAAQASAAQKQAEFLQEGYAQLSLPEIPALPPGSYVLAQGEQAVLLTFTQGAFEVTLILESQSAALDTALATQILAAYAGIQQEKLAAGP
jgi:hypothetical protein